MKISLFIFGIILGIILVLSLLLAACKFIKIILAKRKENKKLQDICYDFWRGLINCIKSCISFIISCTRCIISWVANHITDIFMSIAFISIIVLVYICILYYTNIENESIDLAILTVSFALAAIIPYIVGSSIARNEVEKIVEKKFEALENEYSISLFTLTKQNAHTKRMSANLLKCSEDINKQKWAAGWAAEALISYCRISKKYDGEKYISECIKIISNLNSNENSPISQEKIEDINERTLRSILTMHAYTYLKHQSLCEKIISECKLTKIEIDLLQGFMKEINDRNNSQGIIEEVYLKNFGRNCRISDLNNEIENTMIAEKVKEIIDSLKSELKFPLI